MRETAVAKRARARKILTLLQRAYPDAKIALTFSTPLELLVATILSAQCTDERVNMARGLVERHDGVVPADRDALTALPGVGLKTANVVLGNAFGQDALAVDTHVFRVSQRLGLAKSEDAEEIHDQLVDVLPRGRLTQGTLRP